MLILYRFLASVVYYVTLPFTFIAMLAGSQKWRNRLGYYKPFQVVSGKKTIWLHASSMGEVKVLAIIKNHLEKLDNNILIYITVMTETGFRQARQLHDDKNMVGYFPLDAATPVRKFLKKINPSVAVFIETEIWPVMIGRLDCLNIPIFIANGRLSAKSSRRYQWFKIALGKLLRNYCRIMVQSETDKRRFFDIGANDDCIDVIGSLKFDAPVNIISVEKKARLKNSLPFNNNAPVLIAGSTRKGENEIILDVYKELSLEFPDVRLLLVPRHLERINEIEIILNRMDLKYCLLSDIDKQQSDLPVVVVNKMGILNDLYAVSDIAFVGGTLVDIGGHNILEPVWVGVPVIYGTSVYNVRDSSEYIVKNQFGEMVQDKQDLLNKLKLFFDGSVIYKTKSTDNETSRAAHTAQIILNNIK